MPSSEAPRKSVLVVEDETLLRMVAVEMFEDAGFEVLEAETADDAAQILLEAHSIVGLFTDVEMPGSLDGVGLAHITHKLHPNAAILVVSGRAQIEASDLPPGSRFMSKPYSSVVVLAALQGFLDSV
jgi:CheY-like chemotaxis protein